MVNKLRKGDVYNVTGDNQKFVDFLARIRGGALKAAGKGYSYLITFDMNMPKPLFEVQLVEHATDFEKIMSKVRGAGFKILEVYDLKRDLEAQLASYDIQFNAPPKGIVIDACAECGCGVRLYPDNSNASDVERWWKEHDGHKKLKVDILTGV